jgi:hypothetical protein
VNQYIFRTMIDYTRYPQARRLRELLVSNGQQIAGLRVLDFGCLVADYGMHLAREGAHVAIYDRKEETEFAAFRFQREKLPVEVLAFPRLHSSLMAGRDLVVFGEVLEHVFTPLEILQACVDASVKYIFTSCYPFGNEDYFNLPGHRKAAQEQQPACLELLRANYREIAGHQNERLWWRLPVPKSKA